MQTVTLKGFRLSFQQKHLWQQSQDGQIYRTQCAVKLEGELDPVRFHQALQQVVEHYEILHTTFYITPGMELPMQVLDNKNTIAYLFVDGSHLKDEKQRFMLEEQWQDLQHHPIDLEHGPQLHAVLIRTAAQRHTLLISLPAICADTSTLRLLIPLLLQVYDASSQRKTLPFDENELQYIDVSSWQYELLQEEDVEQQQAFWRKMPLSRLANMPIPFHYERKNHLHSKREEKTSAFQPQQVEVILDADLQYKLLELSQRDQVNPEIYLFACWQILLWRLTDETPLIGLVCEGRPYEELTTVLGPSAWTVPFALNTPFSNQLTFEWVLKQMQQVFEETVEKQLYFNREALVPEYSSEIQAFPISFASTAWPDQWQIGSLQASLQKQRSWHEPSQLHLQITQIGKYFQLHLFAQPSVFSLSETQRLGGLFSTLLRSALATPQALIGSLALLTPEEQVRQRERMQGQQSDWPFVPLHRRFQLQAQHQPHAPAIRCGEALLSYRDVEQQANQLANLLLARGLRPGDRVAIYQRRDIRAIISLLGVLKAGGCYVPLDEDLPTARVRLLLEKLAPDFLLCNLELEERVRECQAPVLLVEHWAELLREQPSTDPPVQVGPEDLAYVMYTSGSTGEPKGVEIRHGSVSNYTQALCELLDVETGWHFATVSSLAADLGNTSIFCGLASGGCVHVLPYTLVTDGAALAHYAEQFPLDVLKIVPSHLQALLTTAGGGVLPKQRLILGGEALPWSLVQQMQRRGATCRLYNHYGPTEATIGALVNALGPVEHINILAEGERSNSVPIGRPIGNMQVSIRDELGKRVSEGVQAELYLAGKGLAAGYLEAPEATRERFVDLEDAGRRERWYRTGDIVRENGQGQIEFIGRKDSQVKLRGYRIELGEIEEHLRRHPDIREAAVRLFTDGQNGQEGYLVGYLVPWKKPGPGQQEVREALLQEMPSYLVPSRIVTLEQLPLSANGKLNRQQLPVPGPQEDQEMDNKLEEGRTPIEEVMLGIWRQVLGVKKIGRNEDFFQLGGHSLLGTRVIARLRTVFGVDVPITWLFEAPTVAKLSERIAEVLRQGQETAIPPLVPATRDQLLPLSFAQQRLWFLDQLEPGSTVYNIPRAARLRGQLNRLALLQALDGVIQRHESLRTTFPMYEGQPVQQIHPQPLTHLIVLDLHTLDPQQREQEARRLALQEAQTPFDLARGSLLRCWLLSLAEQDDHVLLLTMHHIVSDGWSSNILIRELNRLYQAFLQRERAMLPPLPIQYADYALWQSSWLQGEMLTRQLDYWKTRLAGLSPLDLPTDYPRPAIQTFRGGLQRLLLPARLSQQLRALSQREGVTLFMTLLAAFQVLLSRYSGQQDLAIGTPIANRTREEVEGLIGFFINTLVLRLDLSDNPSFVELLAQVRTVALGAYMHQDVPFEQVVEALQPQRDLSRSPLFQVLFELQNMPEEAETMGPSSSQAESFATEQYTAKFELSMVMTESEQGLHTTLEYNSDLFTASTIDRFLNHFQTLLEGIVSAPEQRISALPLLTSAERERLLWHSNQVSQELPPPLHYSLLLAQQVARTPERIAICDQHQQLTYAALWQRVQCVASNLQQQGVGPETLVGLYLERSCSLLISVLAIWQCAAAYVPLDPAYPQERLRLILKQARVPLLLTTATLQEQVPDEEIGMQVLCVEDLEKLEVTDESSPFAVPLLSQHLAYVIYTSGSTGIPKGAMVTHEGMLNHLWAKITTLDLTEADIIAQTASTSFDISVWQLLAGLLQAGRVQILPDVLAHDPHLLLHTVQEKAVTILQVVPSMLNIMLDEPAVDGLASTGLRWLIVTGEAMPRALCQRWWKQQKNIPLLNAYGPTECSDDVTHAILRQEHDGQYWNVPIGTPIINTQLYVLDTHMEPVPQGVIGEIYVGGMGIGRGYLRDSWRTAEVFIPNPYSTQTGSRLYRTGDRGRYREDGQLEFVGRYDGQVKLRGYRIELGEIEALLSQHPHMKQSVVILYGKETQEKRLVAYIVSDEKESANIGTLGSYLKGKLPDYMIPDQFVPLEALPLTPNGKVNRSALPTPHWEDSREEESGGKKLLSPMEELVLQVWQQILHREQIGLQENFFEIGGHSLLATQVVARLRRMIHTEIPLVMLFEAPTISSLANRLQQHMLHSQGLEIPAILPVSRDQDFPLSFAQQRLWFLHQLAPQSAAYTIPIAARLQGNLDIPALRYSLLTLIQRHESLRTIFEEKEGQVIQRIMKEPDISFPLIDLSTCNRQRGEEEVRRLVQQEAEQPFDLARGPLLRCWLLQMPQQTHILLLTMHHIISDGWSMNIFVEELTQLYHASLSGEQASLPALPIQYADYAHWQRSWLQGAILKEHLRYWTGQLSQARALELPTDFPRSPTLSPRGARAGIRLPAELTQQLRTLSHQEGATLFMTLLAAFQILLARSSGQTDVVVGTDSANRSHLETERLIGFFVNLLALRSSLHDHPSFLQVLERVRDMVLGAYAHQELPFEMLVEHLRLPRAGHRTPLINVLFVMQNVPLADADLSDIQVQLVDQEQIHAKFDLALFMAEDSEGLYGSVTYSTDLFKHETIATLMQRYEALLASIVSQPHAKVDSLDISTAEERVQKTKQQTTLRQSLKVSRGERLRISEKDTRSPLENLE
jgi:amino acid adenylation domain-containing protein